MAKSEVGLFDEYLDFYDYPQPTFGPKPDLWHVCYTGRGGNDGGVGSSGRCNDNGPH